MTLKRTIAVIALLMATTFCCKAGTYRYLHINSAMGLPHQQVEALCQDNKGNIWIGTRNGLSRYDGYTLTNYYTDETDSTSLCSNFVFSLFTDSEGRVWIGTSKGISRYNPSTNSFRNYTSMENVHSIVEQSDGRIICGGGNLCYYDVQKDEFVSIPTLDKEFILSLACDSKGRLFVATNNRLYYYDASLKNINTFTSSLYEDFTTGIDGIMPMLFDHAGNLWVGRNGRGVMKLDGNASQIIFKYEPHQLSNGIVRCITEDKEGRLWLGTEKGITIINGDGTTNILNHNLEQVNSLSDNAVYCIYCDTNQNMWVGSYFGGVDVVMSQNKQFHWSQPGYGPNQLKGKIVRMMQETQPGVFWIATEDAGISIYDSNSNSFQSFNALPEIGGNIHSLYYDHESSDMWIGTFRNGLFRYNLRTHSSRRYLLTNGLSSDAIFYFARQKSGRLWVATTQGMCYYDSASDSFIPPKDDYLSHNFVYTLFIDNDDNIWAGTTTGGFFRIDGRTLSTKRYPVDGNTGLKDNYITSLYRDHEGTIWIGTNNNGLQLMRKDGKVESLSNDLLLSKCTICGICESNDHRLWVTTSQGLFCRDGKSDSFRHITSSQGLPTNQFNFSSALVATDGHLLLGTVQGLVELNPSTISFQNQAPQVHIKRLLINNQYFTAGTPDSPLDDDIDVVESLHLSYSQSRSFTIEYGVIMPANNSMVEYQTYLEGADKGWRNVGKELRFVGLDLAPGSYTLHIRANSSGYEWEKCAEKTIRIIIAPPLWRSWWAYLLYIIMCGTLVWFIMRIYRQRQEERQAVRIAKMEKEKLEELDRTKFDFFTVVSHELKTPLSLIVAPLKSISRKNLDKETIKNLDMAIKNTSKMEGLISELVTFNKVETDSFPFYIQRGNPLEFLQNVVHQFHETAQNHQIQLIIDCENNGERVWFSPSYVERIVNNLVSNALKFTKAGGTVIVKAEILSALSSSGKDAEESLMLRISVADTGIGIVAEELPHIFERYYQTKRGYNVNSKGWGIGLSLVRRLTEIHKGQVTVSSVIGQGSTFTVTLCVDASRFDEACRISADKELVTVNQYTLTSQQVESSDETLRENKDVTDHTNNISILLVEDNADLLRFLVDYYAKNYNIHTATNGREALELAHQYSIQLIVSDVMMPEMDGYELCSRLKDDQATSHIPIILLTAKSESEDAVEGYKSGAEAYVTKPFDPRALELQINNIIALRRSQQEAIVNSSESEIKDTICQAELSPYDKDFMLRMNELIEQNIGNSEFSVTTVTTSLGISRTLLHVKMKSLVNMSMGDYIIKKRMELAVRLLRQGYSVADTAYRCGYSDPNYFSRAFKKQFGMTASEFIKTNS